MSLLQNICKYSQCGFIFSSLSQLIEHIENAHINFDAHFLDILENEKLEALPMSYVLPFNVEKDDFNSIDNENPASLINTNLASYLESHNFNAVLMGDLSLPAESVASNEQSMNSELKDDDDDDGGDEDDINGNLNSDEEYSAEFIMRYGSQHSGDKFEEKPFVCPVPGCPKRYKNINGIRYHAKNGHKKFSKTGKNFECFCGKNYKSAQGLKNHTTLVHKPTEFISLCSTMGESLNFGIATNLPNSFDELCKPADETDARRIEVKPRDEMISLNETNEKCASTRVQNESTNDVIDVGDANDFLYLL